MPSIRVLRRSHGLTLVELALRSGIPARTLGAIEYGLQVLDTNSRAQLAAILGVSPELLVAENLARSTSSINPHYVTMLTFALTGALLLAPLVIDHQRAFEDLSWNGGTERTAAMISLQEERPAASRRPHVRSTVRGATQRPATSARIPVFHSLTALPTTAHTPTPEPTVPPTTVEPTRPAPTSALPPGMDAAELTAAAPAAAPTELGAAGTQPSTAGMPEAPAPEPTLEASTPEPPIEAPAPEPTIEVSTAPQAADLPEPPPDAPTAEPTRMAPTAPQAADLRESPPPAPLESDEPHGCPLIVNQGRIVVMQGYGEGTHAPAETWGALDLGVDGDGDGVADPGATAGIPIVATHDGIAHVFPDSWPGGNFVLVENAQAGWSTAYAHLGSIAVDDGQAVRAGTLLGSVGSTGWATAPHLHYEVRRGGVNLDPSPFLACGD
jgi:murein DD-endopeptidase MepM/ murein hydrolase activator NlpD/transcriptional regulator with XRE-family HTH domain